MSNDSIVKFRPFDTVERTVQLVAFDNVASTLLLVWTGLKCSFTPDALGWLRCGAVPPHPNTTHPV